MLRKREEKEEGTSGLDERDFCRGVGGLRNVISAGWKSYRRVVYWRRDDLTVSVKRYLSEIISRI